MKCRRWSIKLVICLLMARSFALPAQTSQLQPRFFTAPADTHFIADHTEKLTARFYLLYQDATFTINPDQGNRLLYKPNVNIRIGIAGFWRWFGLGLSIENPFFKWSSETRGHTSFIDLRVNAYGRAVAAELFLQQYKGFYISNVFKTDGSNYLLPDMKSFSIGISAYWIYNATRFSIRAAFVQNERQIKSAGSFMVRPSFVFSRFTSSDGIIPPELIVTDNIPVTDRVISGDLYSYGLSPGYSYTLVFLRNFYFTATLFPGVYWQFYSYTTKLNSFMEDKFSFILNGRFALGYNSDQWFTGFSFQLGLNDFTDRFANTFFNYDVTQYRVWAGTRFDWFRKKKK